MKNQIMLAAMLSILMFCATSAHAGLAPFPKTWVQGGGYSLESVKGKVVVLYFYEEGCPSCRAKWPPLIAAANSFQGQPVEFIAVNSGNSAGAVQGYLRSVGSSWPGIVDQSRVFEKSAGVGTISLSNIYQMRILRPDGTLAYASTNPGQLKQQIKKELANAKWHIEPSLVPLKYRPAWKASEFGNLKAIAPLLRKTSSDPVTTKFIEALNERVNTTIAERMATAAKYKADGKLWDAYKEYSSIVRDFPSHKSAAEAKKELSPLKRDKAVSKELKAKTALDKILKMLNSTNYRTQKVARTYLQQLSLKYHGTEAAGIAGTMVSPAP
jgi:thiol-disulfide isomerase/thioredoxin